MTTILWLRRDLRIHDHPALEAARHNAEHLVPVFCFDDRLLHGRHSSGPRTQFLLECLADLDKSLQARGSRLVVRRGHPEVEIPKLAAQTKADAVHYSGDVSAFARTRDSRVTGVATYEHPGTFVVDDLDAIRTTAGKPYTVFTPFYRRWAEQPRRATHGAPRRLPPLPDGLDAGVLPTLADLGLTHELEDPRCCGGEANGRKAVRDGSAPLSPYLHFGCVSPREIEGRVSAEVRRQLCWRDFFAHVLLHFPDNSRHEHQARYRGTIRWSHARKRFEAWCEGRTGYPLVDAAMHQLRREGFMDNRARMVVGSFLTKDLGIDWRWGERHFMSLLLDGDQANNNGNWQWIASVGVDPAPVWRRVFNPGPAENPIVDHATARREALARYR